MLPANAEGLSPGTHAKAPLVDEVIIPVRLQWVVLVRVPPVYRFATIQLVPLSPATRPTGTVVNRADVLFRRKRIPQPLGTPTILSKRVLVFLTTALQTPEWRDTLTMSRLSFLQLSTLVVVPPSIDLGSTEGFVEKPHISVTLDTLSPKENPKTQPQKQTYLNHMSPVCQS